MDSTIRTVSPVTTRYSMLVICVYYTFLPLPLFLLLSVSGELVIDRMTVVVRFMCLDDVMLLETVLLISLACTAVVLVG